MPGFARRVGTPKLSMLRTPGTDTLGAASASGTQRFRVTRHFTRPNLEMVTGSISGVTGGWAYSLQTIKAGFFDRGAVLNKLSDIQAKVYNRFGASVRLRAMRSIKSRKGYSKPGMPPSNHTGLLKHKIFYYWNKLTRSVVIGPQLFTTIGRTRINPKSNNNFATIPAVIEHGGVVVGKVSRETRRYAARPFMGPAFNYVYQNQLGGFWRQYRQTPFTP